MTNKAKSSIFIVIISAVLLAIIGCSAEKERKEETKTERITEISVEVPDAEPTPSPTPEPVIDMEEGSYVISEMPLFAIEGTDYTPFSLRTELVDSETVPEEKPEDEAEEEKSEEDGESEPPKVYDTYRVILKSGLRFPDGTPVTADDVLFNIKAHAAGAYKGDYALAGLDIPGMKEYSTQVPDDERQKIEKIIRAGGFDPEEEKYPDIEGIDPKLQDDVWACCDEAGLIFAQNIIDHVNSSYALNAYVNAFMSGYLTYAKVEASESLKTAFAFIVWGYGKKKNPYNYRKNTLTTISDKVYDLNEEEIGAMELWEEIKEYYKGDVSADGIDNDAAPGTKTIEELISEAYFAKQNFSVDEIAGIRKDTIPAYGPDATRECIYITISHDEDLGSFNFFLTEPSEFEKTGELNDPEVIIEFGDEESDEGEPEEGEAQ